ncbi:MAG: hypothetical protein M3044_17295 [Thermoproteota archaeon]|nr:hypothetical protein [Thermoproteota archaeon]
MFIKNNIKDISTIFSEAIFSVNSGPLESTTWELKSAYMVNINNIRATSKVPRLLNRTRLSKVRYNFNSAHTLTYSNLRGKSSGMRESLLFSNIEV